MGWSPSCDGIAPSPSVSETALHTPGSLHLPFYSKHHLDGFTYVLVDWPRNWASDAWDASEKTARGPFTWNCPRGSPQPVLIPAPGSTAEPSHRRGEQAAAGTGGTKLNRHANWAYWHDPSQELLLSPAAWCNQTSCSVSEVRLVCVSRETSLLRGQAGVRPPSTAALRANTIHNVDIY